MSNQPDKHLRAMLPIPDRPSPGLTTYDAKDPDTKFPPIEPLLSLAGGRLTAHLTLHNLAAVAVDPLYASAFGNALLNALETTALCVLIGYPIAYAIALAP